MFRVSPIRKRRAAVSISKLQRFQKSTPKADEQTNRFRFTSGNGQVVMIDEQTGSCGWFFCGCGGWFFCGCGGCRNVGVWGHGNRPTRPATYNLFLCAGWTFLATCVRVYNDEWINGQEWNVVFIQVGFFLCCRLCESV